MIETLEPGGIARRLLLRRVLGAGMVIAIGSRTAKAADAEVVIDNFTFAPTPAEGEGRHDRHLGQPRRHPSQHRLPGR